MRRLFVLLVAVVVSSVPCWSSAGAAPPDDPSVSAQVTPAVEEVAECEGVSWPPGYVPVPDVVQVPSERLGLRSVLGTTESRLGPVDLRALAEEDAANTDVGAPIRVGISRPVPQQVVGEWHDTPDGERLWTTRVTAEGALSLRLHFADVNLPPGGELYVYSAEHPSEASGPYTETGPLRSGEFWAASVLGRTTLVEYYTPDGTATTVPFRIDELAHMYREPLDDLRAPLDCMLDVACYPTWVTLSYAVARIYMNSDGGWGYCSGTLLATENNDLTPYFLTSAHCLDAQNEANTIQFHWFYQHATCNGAMMSQLNSYYADLLGTSGYPGQISGADWTLLLIKGVLPAGVSWSGWTTSSSIGTGTYSVGMHHPDATFKRWSRGRRYDGPYYYFHELHYNIGEGHIYYGSSGSGIWRESDQKLYGNLSFGNGEAGCDNPGVWVYYGRFYRYYSTISSYLAAGSDDTYEDNDTCATAVSVGSGSFTNLVIKSVDEDWYKFGLGQGEQVTINLTFVNANGNINAQLYNACDGSVVASGLGTTDYEVINYTNPNPTRVFYLRVYLANDTRNNYTMSISGAFADCDGNGIADPCDLDCGSPGGLCYGVPGCGLGQDCNNNFILDDCEPQTDCQPNGTLDICDIGGGTSPDCQPDGVPDECELAGNDCNANLVPDECDIAGATSSDCQFNTIPDECDIAVGTSPDCEPNGMPDECEPDCNTNAVADACDITGGTSHDCNVNGRPDECDVQRCYNLWDGFQPNPPFSFQRPMKEIDYNGDHVFWENPANTAVIFPPGCGTGDPFDNAVRVSVPAADYESGYVSSEYFQTEGLSLPPDEQFYLLKFEVRLETALNPKTDWQYFIYDAANDKKVVEIDFTSTVSTRVPSDQRGKILVKNPSGTPAYLNTGVTIALNTCYGFEVILDNATTNGAERVQVFIDGLLKTSTDRLTAEAVRMDYFKLQATSNGSAGTGTTLFKLDNFELCLTGHTVPPSVWDCNGNGFLDECDIASGFSPDCNANGKPDECEGWVGRGDMDNDGDVGLTDYQTFQGCFVGPGGGVGAGCQDADMDCDGDVDLDDFRDFQRAFTGDL